MVSVERTLPICHFQVKKVGKRIPLVEKSGTGNQTWCDVMTGRLPDGGPAVRVRFRDRTEVGQRLDTRGRAVMVLTVLTTSEDHVRGLIVDSSNARELTISLDGGE